MSEMWRVIDTGLRSAAQNIALNRALLEARQAEEIPSTLRFLRFTPSALLGYHQNTEQELNLDYCKANHIAVQRRITGGGAIYCDETQLGWELYLHQRDVGTFDMRAIAKRICHAAASAISEGDTDETLLLSAIAQYSQGARPGHASGRQTRTGVRGSHRG